MLAMKFALLLLFAVPAFAQLPEHGTLEDLRGLTKVYIVADQEPAKVMGKKLKGFSVVGREEDAEFFLEYKTISRTIRPMPQPNVETGQMDAYLIKNGKKVIAWSDTHSAGAFKADTANGLVKRFIKAVTSLQQTPH